MFCPNCRKKVVDDARFCTSCGNALDRRTHSAPRTKPFSGKTSDLGDWLVVLLIVTVCIVMSFWKMEAKKTKALKDLDDEFEAEKSKAIKEFESIRTIDVTKDLADEFEAEMSKALKDLDDEFEAVMKAVGDEFNVPETDASEEM